MATWATVIGAIFQVILLLLQSHNAKDAEAKQLHANKSKEISDAIASGDNSKLNAVISGLRR